MRLPRDLSGRQLAQALATLGYQVDRQTGSHMRLVTQLHGRHAVTVPDHQSLRVKTLAGIISAVSRHHSISRDELLRRLFP